MTSGWHRRSGLVTTADGLAGRCSGFLEGALVPALVESEPENPDAVTVVVAVDDEGRVAVLGDDRSTIVPGPSLAELATALADATSGEARFDDVVAGEHPDASDDPSDPFDPEIEVDSAYWPDRSVVFTRGSVDDVMALATTIDLPVLAAPHGEGQLVLVTDGPALAAFEWPEALKPALVLEQGTAYPAVAVVDGDTAHLHTWDATVEVVPSAPETAAVVTPFVDAVLGTGALVDQVVGLLPDADPARVREAIEGPGAGPARLVGALGLPESLVGFLGHGADLPHLEDSRVVEPESVGHAFARAVTDAQAQMSESVRERTELMRERAELMRERAEQMRERAEAARVRAESAFDAAETFTEEVVVPIRQTWWTPAVAAVEVAAGALLLRRAGRGSRAGTGTTAGERVVAVGGALLLVDAVVNTAIFVSGRLRREI
ncbi:hypothetical protein [Actinotalea caeni]|uniref:hypothetical protein n=1 Tax=Actinotalea caeni TaxID=1348467 RepID=UPI0012E27D4B|nr:hypothetical protein [Actinotalea caeni]